jgi:hypothetical protein
MHAVRYKTLAATRMFATGDDVGKTVELKGYLKIFLENGREHYFDIPREVHRKKMGNIIDDRDGVAGRLMKSAGYGAQPCDSRPTRVEAGYIEEDSGKDDRIGGRGIEIPEECVYKTCSKAEKFGDKGFSFDVWYEVTPEAYLKS